MIQRINGVPVLAKVLVWPNLFETMYAIGFTHEPLSLEVACYSAGREIIAPLEIHSPRRLTVFQDDSYQFMGNHHGNTIINTGDARLWYEETGVCLVRVGAQASTASIAFSLKSHLMGA